MVMLVMILFFLSGRKKKNKIKYAEVLCAAGNLI